MYKVLYIIEGERYTKECPDFNLQDDWIVLLKDKMVWINKDNVIKIQKL